MVFRARLTATVSLGSSTVMAGRGLSLRLGITPDAREWRPWCEDRNDDCPGDESLRDILGAVLWVGEGLAAAGAVK